MTCKANALGKCIEHGVGTFWSADKCAKGRIDELEEALDVGCRIVGYPEDPFCTVHNQNPGVCWWNEDRKSLQARIGVLERALTGHGTSEPPIYNPDVKIERDAATRPVA